MQIKAKLLEGPSLLEWSGSLYTNTLAIRSTPCILCMAVFLYQHHLPRKQIVKECTAQQTEKLGI